MGNEQNFKALNNIKERMKGNLAIIKEGQEYIDKIGKESLKTPFLKPVSLRLKDKAMKKHLTRIDGFSKDHWKKVVKCSKLNLQGIERENDRDKSEIKTYRTLAPWEKVLSDARQENENPEIFNRPHRASFYNDQMRGRRSYAKKDFWTPEELLTSFCFSEKDIKRHEDIGRLNKMKFKQTYKIKSSSVMINPYDVLHKLPLPSAVTGVMLRLGHLDKK